MQSLRICPIIELDRPFTTYQWAKDKGYLHQKYVVEGKSCDEIARESGMARTSVLRYLREHGVPIRPTGQSVRRWNQPYGQRIVGGKVVPVRFEQKQIAWMLKRRAEGYSFRRIAEMLNRKGIPTKTRRGQWQGKTVQQIVRARKPGGAFLEALRAI